MNTVQDPDIVALYRKINENPEYLDVPNEMTFVESPLHTAASEGRTGLALEILRLKPSLGKKLNLDVDNSFIKLETEPNPLLGSYDRAHVMKSLIKYVHVNKKNLEVKTALDILEPEIFEARKILISAGAIEGSSLDDATSCENYLKSRAMTIEHFFKFGAYMDFGVSGNMRNAILVVVVLIATATFQAILTPPFAISHNDTHPICPSITSVYNDTTTHNDTTPVFPSITFVYNDTTSTNSTSTNFNKRTPSVGKESIIFNSIAFGLAMGTCAILTLSPLQVFLSLPLSLFSVSYAALEYEIYAGPFILVAVVSLIILPYLVILPWMIIKLRSQISDEIYHEYNLDEVKFLMFCSTAMNQGPIVTWMAARKASR
ncbi:unnamed protein product [Fraxinus pennsylvanica]|uniref:PGG domain-containing protein n=1 Tax=Fraxinus pennsylvanica TaxID=56036 RepID=A0AAD2EAA8_9LAMI|nr:unnamed protein product [Fraxinus pennsylvanica]